MEETLNERQSLAIIEEMINRAKNNFSESGTLFILWGVVIFLCSIISFVCAYFFDVEHSWYIWALTWPTAIYQIIYIKRRQKKRQAKIFTDDILKYMWLTFFLCLALLVLILIYRQAFITVNPAILIMYGIPTFLSGIILKFKPLVAGGICCWLLAIGCTLTDWHFQLLYIGAAAVAAWIIPGIYLRRKYLKENKQ
jgi:hypothetical protein